MGFSVDLGWLARHTYRAELDNGLVEHEIDHLFAGWFQDDKIYPDPMEVEAYRWLPLPELRLDMQQSPGAYTPWFASTLEKVLNEMRHATTRPAYTPASELTATDY
ncbi:MAG: hypothetical protein DHS20C01_09730 [marine bacterium B5-7]|nr:MAG: hypothetical protein DHS20C01_09730 [marine bacterium B5-7]